MQFYEAKLRIRLEHMLVWIMVSGIMFCNENLEVPSYRKKRFLINVKVKT